MSAAPETQALRDYADFMLECECDPLLWNTYVYPWDEPGTALEGKNQHDWQVQVDTIIRNDLAAMEAGTIPRGPIRIACKSGHGIGKSAKVAMLNNWCVGTMVDARGVTTANTDEQLRRKTWAELSKWHNLSLSKQFFEWTATSLFSNDPAHQANWQVNATPWSERNPEAFQGLHNAGKRVLIIFDEASSIPHIIWESIEGAQTDDDTQIIWIVFGNPTRNSGRFYECFGKRKNFWHTITVDSRDVPGTNLALFKDWEEQYGEDSDFFRVRVKGQFPRASAEQFIPSDWVEDAMKRKGVSMFDDPLICGIDFARSGNCRSVMYWRRGKDGNTHKPDIFADDANTSTFIAKCASRLNDLKPDIIFGDADGLGGPIVDRLLELGFPIIGVHSASSSEFPDSNRNKRADMWQKGKNWIRDGGALWNNDDFLSELTTMEVVSNQKGTLQIEAKEHLMARGEPSPDLADAFMLTHAYEITEMLSVEHMESDGHTTARMDYDQWDGTRTSDQEDTSETSPERRARNKRIHLRGS